MIDSLAYEIARLVIQRDAHAAPHHNGLTEGLTFDQQLTMARELVRLREMTDRWRHEKPGRKFILDQETIQLVQSTLGYYASFDTWLGARTGGVLQGCPRGEPDIHRDQGQYAGEAYCRLVNQYPLKEIE